MAAWSWELPRAAKSCKELEGSAEGSEELLGAWGRSKDLPGLRRAAKQCQAEHEQRLDVSREYMGRLLYLKYLK